MKVNLLQVLSKKSLVKKFTGFKIILSCFIGAALICLIAEAIGQTGMEAVLRFDLNWGSKYAYQTNSKKVFGSGIFRYFGVPIFDGSQHLGIRLPNFASNYTLHPLVFLSKWISTYRLTRLYVFLSISLVFYFISLTFKSWNLKYWKTATLFSSTALSGPIFIFLIHLDWAITVTTFCGIFTLTTVLVDKALYLTQLSTSDLHRVLAKLVFAFSLLITSHPVGFFIAIPLFVLSAIRFVRLRPISIPYLKFFSAFIPMMLIVLISVYQILEKSSEQIRLGSGSLFDFFQPQRVASPLKFIFSITVAVFVSALQPIFWILDLSPHITSRSDFLAWPLLAGAFAFSFIRSKHQTKSVFSLRKNIKFSFSFYLLSSILVGLVSKHKFFGISWIIRADGWEYVVAMFGIVVISSPILLLTAIQSNERILDFKFWRKNSMVSSLLLVGFAVSISYPIVALIKGPSVVATASYEQLKNSDGLSIVQRTNLRANRRFIFLKSEVFEGTRGLSSLQRGWLPILGIPHPLILSRNGYPTPAGTPSYQDPGTLSNDLGYTEFYANQCSPRLYDFLGIDTIIADNQDKGCSGQITRYFGSGSEIHHFQPEICYGIKTCSIRTRLGEKDFSGLSVNAIQPKAFHSFYLTEKFSDDESVCALENSSCLEKLQSDQYLKLNENPLKFCEQTCWINYDYKIPENARFLVIPVNFDKSISVIDQDTKQSLKLENVQGLVGVRTVQDQLIGTLEINIVADIKMKMWVFATYLHTFLLAYLIFLLFKTRVEVSVKE